MPQEFQGRITQVTAQGNLISDIPSPSVAALVGVPEVRVEVGDHFTLGIFHPTHSEPESTLIAVLGVSGFVEVGIVGMNAAELLGVRVGDVIRIRSG